MVAHTTRRGSGPAQRGVEPPPGPAVDVWAPLGSLPRRFRRRHDDFEPRHGYLKPASGRIAFWRDWLGEGPAVGLSWRSGLNAGRRARNAPALAAWAPLLQTGGVRFVHLQYGAQTPELDLLDAMAAAPLLRPPLDLRDDLDELAALCTALDLLVSVPNATAALAAACGAQTWFLTAPNAWPRLGTDGYPWYARARSFQAGRFGAWAPVLEGVTRALDEELTSGLSCAGGG